MPFARTEHGRLPVANAVEDISCAGYANVGIRLSGSWSGTVTFQGSTDGASFDTLTVLLLDGVTTATTATSAGQWRVNCSGLSVVRCKMTSFVSGSAVVDMLASSN